VGVLSVVKDVWGHAVLCWCGAGGVEVEEGAAMPRMDCWTEKDTVAGRVTGVRGGAAMVSHKKYGKPTECRETEEGSQVKCAGE
jgi:hypothetical protein